MQDLRKKKVLSSHELVELTKEYEQLKVIVVPATENMPEYIKLIDKDGLCTYHFAQYKLIEFNYCNFISNLPEDEQIPVDNSGENNESGSNENPEGGEGTGNENEGGNGSGFNPGYNPGDPGDNDPEEPEPEIEPIPSYITLYYEGVISGNGLLSRVVFLEEDGLHTFTEEDLFVPYLYSNCQFLGYKIKDEEIYPTKGDYEVSEYLQVGDKIGRSCTLVCCVSFGKSPYGGNDDDDDWIPSKEPIPTED